ncbi:biogenesis of lysosome-related organelles complex 1 subunit 5 isoform X2 [Globicephala melas]|uniref:biogenesis of lysosome-related organelles complex 1 subunit 5 isoform X2 n=1 Tax=Globicephala melas TaxID=9731 RepID=UPI00293D26B8|nr:biogenesis of lysosome-related organelles complex 1 subunit 5 isoform X2 [Globicephala melas]XP_060163633.1 biogenesis of lysosome-related organelles complex 1 subunit 5 isoform X2 [Globicephala melas]XP_060163634.1 biogenesis of lysosome-related organelles complex 1 subunit 5 isoform X2 [Globicephala melas]XP_060163635.1 biogenesis of lysosome-related organelles complex 1 subunit 5 isoform X2 [Globicephala melas]
MSGGGTETPVVCEAASGGGGGGGGKKKDSLGTAGSPAHLIIKDLGEIHSRLLDHRPVIQGETRYFVKEFEEKRGLREMRVLENLKNMIHETNERTLPACREAMHDSLNHVLQRLQAATDSVCRLQQREQERNKPRREACGILVPRPRIEPQPSAVKAPNPTTCTAREFPGNNFHMKFLQVPSATCFSSS